MQRWLSMEFPYGSEFPWDSTGHEEIHTWLLNEGEHAAANKTVGAVLAYMSVFPHWAFSGSARRYWDYVINGKSSLGNEREFHHCALVAHLLSHWPHPSCLHSPIARSRPRLASQMVAPSML